MWTHKSGLRLPASDKDQQHIIEHQHWHAKEVQNGDGAGQRWNAPVYHLSDWKILAGHLGSEQGGKECLTTTAEAV